MPVQVFYGNTAITSHYVSRLLAEIGADIHHDCFQAKYNWNDQQWCYIAWDSYEMIARRTQTNKAINRGKLVLNWLNLKALKELSLSTTTTPITLSSVPAAIQMKTSATC